MVALAVLDGLALLQKSLVGLETQSLGRNSQHVVLLESVDSNVGCKTWLKFQIVVGGRDYYLVGNNVALGSSLLANLSNLSLKVIIGECIDCEANTLTYLNTAYISLVDICHHTHVGKVLCDNE